MAKDACLHAFIVAQTSESRRNIRRISIHKRWLTVAICLVIGVLCAASYGFYSLSQEATRLRVERENSSLRQENQNQRLQLNDLKQRVEAVEAASRRLAEMSGVAAQPPEQQDGTHHPTGAGGPRISSEAANIIHIERRATQLERKLQRYEIALRERAAIPSIWPVEGEVTDGFGKRHNPFGGASSEFHTGQDVAALRGTPVIATGSGRVAFAGFQGSYGRTVVIDHGSNLTTRYAHLSRIDVTANQPIIRGEVLGQVGSTGRSTGPHLHYEIRISDAPVNPKSYLPPKSY